MSNGAYVSFPSKSFIAAFSLALLVIAGSVGVSDVASAQNYGVYYRPRQIVRQPVRPIRREVRIERERSVKREPVVAKSAATVKPAAIGEMPTPLVAIVNLGAQRIQVYDRSGVIAQSRVSTGKAGHSTPTGVFSVLQRNRYHESNIYSGAPMPYMQRLTWSGIAMHEGVVPGYPASHGCIRLPAGFANEMWGIGRIGMRVVVAPSDAEARAIEHPRLPTPILTPVPVSELPERVKTAAIAGAQTDGDSERRLLDPYKLALARKITAAAERVQAEAAVKPALAAAHEASAEANRAAERLRAAERALETAAGALTEKREAAARDQTVSPDSELGKAVTAAEAALAAAEQALTQARAEEMQKSDAAFSAARGVREAEARADAAVTAQRLANAGVDPITIFVSRKEGRVLIRQGFVPIHEESISFNEPERPLGTHVFTAMDSADGGTALKWSVVTVPSNPPGSDRASEKPRKGAIAELRIELPPSSAANVLDRFELSEATRKLVAEKLWPGATLMVSDFGVSGETGKGTDFIVLTK